ncbi:anthranilate synthase component 1 [Colwellia sp. MB02u-18]|uniref:anthranilate synthase component 1 n=1 Tax=unclassified Colwellia TaxID=196834 RepID=UPI0015F40887|nr:MULTISPECIES: anthranilate synthase component 1 [unclassified Colwellia]MBA6223002.1 anthranilate synthase component 1 [Colwellia sp. MB3u-45]MBA6266171.1 anthranilate synthase component 1 [Colwellia sp. MB3u-43]MBA6319647.1 anthranilate synthase component 1 [Colwellia sp. MB02u-19]MBA6324255.1 anthranilate synthase component 1 [Colwellia sp. MB02u-18]MBA6329941.1 anthranilate synthase component 1 [Colwellia sp. MB02u-12]
MSNTQESNTEKTTEQNTKANTETNTKNIPLQTAHDHQESGAVVTITDTLSYQSDPLAVFHTLCADKENTLLLESAEIDKKHQLKSLLLTDTAVKIVCNGHIVSFTALSKNGENALSFAKQALASVASITGDNQAFTASFAQVTEQLDERSRLLAVNPFQSLRLFNQLKNINKHPFAVFLGGAFAFDMMAISESLPEVEDSENSCPDFVYYLAETLIIIDHEKRSSEVITNQFTGTGYETAKTAALARIKQIKASLCTDITATFELKAPDINSTVSASQDNTLKCDIDDDAFCQIVDDLKENILAGDIFQVVPSRTFSLICSNNLNAYKALKQSNPSPYMFYLQDSEFCIFGASPESALKYQQSNRQVEIYPIAGTRPRGFNPDGSLSPDLDSRIELDLRLDKKELAEHIMLVDLARNDIARVSQPGTRHVAELLKVDRYSHVMHLVSRVCGTLEDELDALHAYQACMNMGTLSGAPKVKATSLIREVEGKRRGSYGGAVGYLTGEGDMDTCIVIRSAFVKNKRAQIQAGAGVVFDSDPQSETNETRQKAQAVISAIKEAEGKVLIISHQKRPATIVNSETLQPEVKS